MAVWGGSFDLYDLPEDCIANVLSLTSPCDVGRLSSVSSMFRSAGNSDSAWRRFLPPDHRCIIARSADPSYLRSLPLKELYFSLCSNPILIDEGTKSFSLDRRTGKKCYMLSARELAIVWGDTPRYWEWNSSSDPKSRFAEVAVLLCVCWLEITGKINVEALSTSTRYAAYFVFSLTGAAYGLERHPVEVGVGLVGGESSTRNVYLDKETPKRQQYQLIHLPFRPLNFMNPMRSVGQRTTTTPRRDDGDREFPKERGDGWWEIEIGEFTTGGGLEGELEMRIMEVNGGNWKSGLLVHGIEIRPKDTR